MVNDQVTELPPDWFRESDEVFFRNPSKHIFGASDVNSLINLAELTPRKRARLCIHEDPEKDVHQMLIVHPRNAYIQPHKHLSREEIFMVLDGSVEFIEFDNQGSVCSRDMMGNYNSGRTFIRYIPPQTYHSILIHSERLVFFEVTEGPFRKSDTVFAEWSPEPQDKNEVRSFLKGLTS